MTRPALAGLLAALVGVSTLGATGFSGATFTDSSRSVATVTAAADWTPPVVVLTAVPATVSGSLTLQVQASDAETGVAETVVEARPAGSGTWSVVCTDRVAPYSCAWDTTKLADGPVTLRARATDTAGYSSTSTLVTTTVANAAASTRVTLGDPGEVLRGVVPLTVASTPAGRVTSIKVEHVLTDGASWKTLCTVSGSSGTCSWNTLAVADESYDLRAVGTTSSGTVVSDVLTDVTVDNTRPTVALRDPGTRLAAQVVLTADAADDGSGVEDVVIQYAAKGSPTWLEVCRTSEDPYSCTLDTRALAGGGYLLRAVATDLAGNTSISPVLERSVDNVAAWVGVGDPGSPLAGALRVAATTISATPIAHVRIQRSPAGTATWTDLCTDTTAPYDCAWDTSAGPDGMYDLRALMVDGRGTTTTSAVVKNRLVDNSPLRAADVQAANGGVEGRIDAGDTLVLTYTERVQLQSFQTGWTGGSLAVTLRARDGRLVGSDNTHDAVDILRGSSVMNFGRVDLHSDVVKKNRTALYSATVTATDVLVGDTTVTRVTVVVGNQTSGIPTKRSHVKGRMVWAPTPFAKDLAAHSCSTTPATESGAADVDF